MLLGNLSAGFSEVSQQLGYDRPNVWALVIGVCR